MDFINKYLSKNISEQGIIKLIIFKYLSNNSADIFIKSGIHIEVMVQYLNIDNFNNKYSFTHIYKNNRKIKSYANGFLQILNYLNISDYIFISDYRNNHDIENDYIVTHSNLTNKYNYTKISELVIKNI